MTKSLILALAALSIAGSALAQAPAPAAPAPPPPRAKGPALAPSVAAALAAVETCKANGYKVTALIVDSAGDAVVMLSGDGVALRTQGVAATKTSAVIRYKMSSGDVVAKAKTDPAMDAEIKADPKIGIARQGALPIMSGGELIGAFAISGAPGGDKDEVCVRAGLAKSPLG
jgi:uncharacterized protein GlcG (DUF336 family)